MGELLFTDLGDGKKWGELCDSRLFLGLRIEPRIPLVEVVSEFFIQNSRQRLQEADPKQDDYELVDIWFRRFGHALILLNFTRSSCFFGLSQS